MTETSQTSEIASPVQTQKRITVRAPRGVPGTLAGFNALAGTDVTQGEPLFSISTRDGTLTGVQAPQAGRVACHHLKAGTFLHGREKVIDLLVSCPAPARSATSSLSGRKYHSGQRRPARTVTIRRLLLAVLLCLLLLMLETML